ncbi:MAG: alpha/beta fold hydrolase [Polyangiaceae bacterium]
MNAGSEVSAELVEAPPSTRLAAPQRTAPQALWFGPPERPLFGWYHAARAPLRGAVVLCSAFGHEEMATHRGYLHIAEQLARDGFAALRFDYDGTGDSAGNPSDEGRVQAWLDSIGHARRKVAELSGAERLVLFGARLGAWLALAEAARNPVDALILFAPPRSGRAWLREVRALAALHQDAAAPTKVKEAALVGFAIGEDACNEVSSLEWQSTGRAPARRVLLLKRDDLPGGEEDLGSKLRERGVDVSSLTTPGYAAFFQDDPVRSKPPLQAIAAMADWLREANLEADAPASRAPTMGPVSTRKPLPQGHVQIDADVRESTLSGGDLFGVLSEPTTPGARARSALVLLNIGANHHVGSNRMYVPMARRVARAGFRVARVDFSGIGDSAVAASGKENEVYCVRFFAEARAIVDQLFARGVDRVVLAGLCSGAYAAYHTATADARVSGIVMVNPLTFHWREGDSLEVRMRQGFKSTHFYRRALWHPATWKRLARGEIELWRIARELGKRAKVRVERESNMLMAKLSGTPAETGDIERGFRKLSARGTRCLLVYGSNDGGIDVLEEHLGANADAMRGDPNFRLEILEGPDHTFTPLWAQQKLLEMVESFMLAHFANG